MCTCMHSLCFRTAPTSSQLITLAVTGAHHLRVRNEPQAAHYQLGAWLHGLPSPTVIRCGGLAQVARCRHHAAQLRAAVTGKHGWCGCGSGCVGDAATVYIQDRGLELSKQVLLG